MTGVQDLEALLTVSQARFDRRRQALALIQKEETALRAELARLKDMALTARAPSTDMIGMRSVGADLLWQGWIARGRTEKNMALARVLARKGHEVTKLRRAFGRVAALEEVIGAQRSALQDRARKAQLATAIEMGLDNRR